MEPIHSVGLLVSLAAGFAWVNVRLLKLPRSIALMLLSLLTAGGVLAVGQAWPAAADGVRRWVQDVHFADVLLEGMLGALLFAGALHVDLNDLARRKWSVGLFATAGVVGTTLIVGGLLLAAAKLLGLPLSPIHCFLFGALIAPTDPIAVLAIIRKVGAPGDTQTMLTGESLFNDGLGVVVFLTLLDLSAGGEVGAGQVALVFCREAFGGVAFGLVVGWAGYLLLRGTDNYQVEIMVTLAMVTGGYALGSHVLHVSGPLAMVAAGLLIGNRGVKLAMTERTREHLLEFWEMVDAVLTAVLFVLIGLEALLVNLRGDYLFAGALMIPAALLARLVCVGGSVELLRRFRPFAPRVVRLLVWGGLRGGLAVAMALSLPAGPARDAVLAITYVVVAFSILVQGTTFAPLARPRAA
jgi:CPA1 family monovalent cation:H+ antiporter